LRHYILVARKILLPDKIHEMSCGHIMAQIAHVCGRIPNARLSSNSIIVLQVENNGSLHAEKAILDAQNIKNWLYSDTSNLWFGQHPTALITEAVENRLFYNLPRFECGCEPKIYGTSSGVVA
jgi:hypothetical protein